MVLWSAEAGIYNDEPTITQLRAESAIQMILHVLGEWKDHLWSEIPQLVATWFRGGLN
jgi:hypothetical protein